MNNPKQDCNGPSIRTSTSRRGWIVDNTPVGFVDPAWPCGGWNGVHATVVRRSARPRGQRRSSVVGCREGAKNGAKKTCLRDTVASAFRKYGGTNLPAGQPGRAVLQGVGGTSFEGTLPAPGGRRSGPSLRQAMHRTPSDRLSRRILPAFQEAFHPGHGTAADSTKPGKCLSCNARFPCRAT